MAPPPAVETLLAPVRAAPHQAALLLDVDGTLAPIVPRAADAVLLPGVRPLLERAEERYGLVAFLTGRSVADFDRMVEMPHLPAGMNHGLQLRRNGVVEVAPEAIPFLDTVRAFSEEWANAPVLRTAGIWLEDKGPTLSFHYRSAPDPAYARGVLESHVLPAVIAAGLAGGWGRRVLEVRPPVRVNKGTAARALLAGTDVTAAVYFGDDRTDTDAWRELRAMRESGELVHVACILARSAEVDREVAEMADAEVDGAPGVRDALKALLEVDGH
ncbi:MAG: trehalose-phosphatase [Thermoleophilia bacterium]|nr:trehalose-phosphatase [Thermoleophilia bacterium]MDH3725230.1 trehalose-phosphatase [Thermoleophilia bacterium]